MAEESKAAVLGAVFANTAIAIAKYAAAAVTRSSAMLSEAIHSTVDTGNGLLLLLGQKRRKKPADVMHPFGHGQELYFWTFVVALIVFAVGGGMSIYEGILHILSPEPITDPTWNYVVLGLSGVFEGISWTIALKKLLGEREGRSLWKTVRETKEPQAMAVLFEDSAALLGVLIAFAGVFLGHALELPQLDGAASILIGLLLCTVAFLLSREAKSLLLGESADPRLRRRIQELVESDPAVQHMGRSLTMQLSPDEVLLTLEVGFKPELTTGELARAVDALEHRIRQASPEVRHIFIEAEALAHP